MPASLRRLAAWFAVAGGLAACIVAVLTLASVVGRAAWRQPIPGDVELTQFGVALGIALCLPWAQLQGSNIIVDFFTQKLRPAGRRRLDALGALLLSAMMGVLAWRTAVGAVAVRSSMETSMILGLPMWVAYAVLAPGFALTALIALLQMGQHLRGETPSTGHLPEEAGP